MRSLGKRKVSKRKQSRQWFFLILFSEFLIVFLRVACYLKPSPVGKVAAKPTDEEIAFFMIYAVLLIHRKRSPFPTREGLRETMLLRLALFSHFFLRRKQTRTVIHKE